MSLSSTPTEDVSHLLVTPPSASGEFDFDAPRDYLPDPNIDWVVTIEFSDAKARERIEKALDIPWQKDHGLPTIFGFAPEEGHWTYVSSADAPASFDKLKLAWTLWDAIDEKPKDISADQLRQFRVSAEQQLKPLGKLGVSEERTPEDVVKYINTLPALFAECDRDVTLVLRAPGGEQFSGRDVWGVMLCLGLDYGDGDLFHWINNSGFGADHFFTVETSTPPGYFIPRRMASGEGDVDDLMFGFSIPRSADPLAVFDSMVKAVEYAQSRLGGEIVLVSGEPFDRTDEHAKIADVVQKLQDAGFAPGQSAICRVF